jgi:hypothetical protein
MGLNPMSSKNFDSTVDDRVPRGSPCLGHVAPFNLSRICHLSEWDWSKSYSQSTCFPNQTSTTSSHLPCIIVWACHVSPFQWWHVSPPSWYTFLVHVSSIRNLPAVIPHQLYGMLTHVMLPHQNDDAKVDFFPIDLFDFLVVWENGQSAITLAYNIHLIK